MATFDQFADETLDYDRDWGPDLKLDESIVSSVWRITGPDAALSIVAGSDSIAGSKTILWLQGGTPGAVYTITNEITTSSGPITRAFERSFTVLVRAALPAGGVVQEVDT